MTQQRRRREWSGPTEAHLHILFVVDQNGPITANEIARHMLVDPSWVRSRARTLEWNSLLGRSYTRYDGDGRFGYEITYAGARELEAADTPDFDE